MDPLIPATFDGTRLQAMVTLDVSPPTQRDDCLVFAVSLLLSINPREQNLLKKPGVQRFPLQYPRAQRRPFSFSCGNSWE